MLYQIHKNPIERKEFEHKMLYPMVFSAAFTVYLCQTQYKAPATPFDCVGNTQTASKTKY